MQTLYEIGFQAWALLWTPVLIWSVAMILLMGVLRLIPSRYPQLHLDLRLAGLLALLVAVLLSMINALIPETMIPALSFSSQYLTIPSVSSVEVTQSTGLFQFTWLHAVGAMTVAAIFFSIFGIARLVVGHLRLKTILKNAREVDLGPLDLPLLDHHITVSSSDQVSTPFSTGLFEKRIVIPTSLMESDRRAVVLHEFNHLVNGDIFRAWIGQICRALFFFHPLVHFVHSRSMLFCEIVCDRRTLLEDHIEPRYYADVLVRNAPADLHHQPVLTLVHSPSQLRQRILAMKNRVSLPFASSQLLVLGTCTLLMLGLIAGCSEYDLGPTDANLDPDIYDLVMELPVGKRMDKPFVIVEQSPVLIDGLRGLQAGIKYPEIAKKAGVEGRVYLQFVVDETGKVVDAVVTRGIGAGCDEEALRAVEASRFVPGVQDGHRVRVKMSLPVMFKLSESEAVAGAPTPKFDVPIGNFPRVRPEVIEVYSSFKYVDFEYDLMAYSVGSPGKLSTEVRKNYASDNRGTAIVMGHTDNRSIVDSRIAEIASNPSVTMVIRRKN